MDAEQLMEKIGEHLASSADVASMEPIYEDGHPPQFGIELASGERFVVTIEQL